ncbi:hypothetical protein MTBLM1_60024 [Rhodospirillaceae bacterium LM-1]|nr:hypothetical protein MTBLM1_60024 [Rhodospirillaceae bacterium LM-1]
MVTRALSTVMALSANPFQGDCIASLGFETAPIPPPRRLLAAEGKNHCENTYKYNGLLGMKGYWILPWKGAMPLFRFGVIKVTL